MVGDAYHILGNRGRKKNELLLEGRENRQNITI
jgi:hypothetical protein